MAYKTLCLAVCHVFRREAEAVLETEEFAEVTLRPYPPDCLGMPGQAEKRVGAIESSRREFRRFCRFAVPCVCAEEDRKEQGLSLFPRNARQCLELVADGALLDHLQIQCENFVVSPGWLDLWRDFIRKWGFDRETAQAFFRESVSGVVLLDTGIDPKAEQHAADFAAFIGLPHKKIAVGLDHVRLLFTACVLSWRLDRVRASENGEKKELIRKLGNYALMAEVIRGIAAIDKESRVLEKGLEFVSVMLAPGRMVYVPVVKGVLSAPLFSSAATTEEGPAWEAFLSSSEEYAKNPSGQGFLIRVRHGEETVGIIDVDRIAFPQYLDDYLNLLLSYVTALALAVVNARYYEELLRDQELLEIQARTDPLTGALNRGAVMEKLVPELERAKRERRPICVAMLDIDHFKQVNDRYGHAAGDAVLKAVIGVISRSLRGYDFVGRLGGEEFLIIAPGADPVNAGALYERLRREVEEHRIDFDGIGINVTASIGYAACKGEVDVNRLIHLADEAMYRAKKAGRNRVEFAGYASD